MSLPTRSTPTSRSGSLPAVLAVPARSALRRPVAWLVGILGVTLLVASHLPSLEVRTDGASLHPADHPTVVLSRQDRARFYEPEQVILLARLDGSDRRWDDLAGLTLLTRLHEDLKRLPEVDAQRVRSAATLLEPPRVLPRRPTGPAGGPPPMAPVRPYLHPPPTTVAEAAETAAALHDHPLAHGLFLSRDGRLAVFYLPLVPREPGVDRVGQLASLERRLPSLGADGARLQLDLLGPAVAEARLGDRVVADLARLLPGMLLVMVILLALALRSVAGVMVPLASAGVVLLWTFGAMAATGVPLTLVTTIVPVVLVSLAVTDEVHLLERVRSQLAAEPDPGRAAVVRATFRALEQVGPPIVLTSLTTAAGFLSFLSASLPPVRHFGTFVAVGILLALVFTFTLVPALLVLLPPRWVATRRRPGKDAGTGPAAAPGWLERRAAAHPPGAAVAALLALVLLVPGVARLDVQDSWIANFSPESPLVRADRRANEAFWGTYRLDVVLDHPERGFFRTPAGVALAERVREEARRAPHVAGVVTHLLPFEALAEARGMPHPLSSADETALLQVAGSAEAAARLIDLRWFLDPEARGARLRLLVRDADYHKARELRDALERHLPPVVAGSGASFHLSGDLPLAVDVVDAVVGDQLRSLAWTLAAIALLVALALRRLRATAAVLAPPVAAVAAVLGGMGWTGLPLGIATSTFAALTLGVGVDFGIHLEAAFRRHRASGRVSRTALEAALAGSGRALRWNTAVLATGFLVLTLSTLAPNRNLGLLLAAGLAASWLAALLLLPALLAGRRTVRR